MAEPELADESLFSPNRLLTRLQAAGHLGVSVATVTRLVKEGQLPYVMIGTREKHFRIGDLDNLILSRMKRD